MVVDSLVHTPNILKGKWLGFVVSEKAIKVTKHERIVAIESKSSYDPSLFLDIDSVAKVAHECL